MNDKKSVFGDLCHQYRGRLHLSEADMGKRIEELGYRLGYKEGGNRQPLISQFERELDPPGAKRRQHRDPPLDYVEKCAELFNLDNNQKYDLFVAAIKSSEKIVIDNYYISENMLDNIANIIAFLILNNNKTGNIKSKLVAEYTYPNVSLIDNSEERKLYQIWVDLEKNVNMFRKEIKEFPSMKYQHD